MVADSPFIIFLNSYVAINSKFERNLFIATYLAVV